jgi:3-dehydroquinate synthase
MGKSKIYSKIIYTENPRQELIPLIKQYGKDKIFLVTEENVDRLWGNDFSELTEKESIKKVIIPSGEENKKIDSVTKIWEFLSKNGADRKSLLINLGGGMLTDLAGFAASTFKRGIDFLNIPTTLLSQVDASVGGKTGINFNGLKNEIGVFKEPVAVIIYTGFLKTLDKENFLSGFAEMIKHGLIHSPAHLLELQRFDINNIEYNNLKDIIQHSVEVKQFFVNSDPTEQNIRKALNFGHTIGHSFESLAMEQKRPVMHGYAVAWGMIAELYLSVKKCGYSIDNSNKISSWLHSIYGKFIINGVDFERLFELMLHDKKNESGRINFTLLSDTGKIEINQNCTREMVFEALDIFRNLS